MKFVADAMLGKLAKWLRLAGQDVSYVRDIADRDLIRLSKVEDRTILTRDTGIMKRKGLKAIFIHSDDILLQLEEMNGVVRFDPELPPRCELCNGILTDVPDRASVAERVPEFVYRTASVFSECSHCRKVYWEGTHTERIRRTLATAGSVHSGERGN